MANDNTNNTNNTANSKNIKDLQEYVPGIFNAEAANTGNYKPGNEHLGAGVNPTIKKGSINQKSRWDVDNSITFANQGLDFDIPNWGIPNFINEKSSWQKGLHSLTGEPGFFYFKIFFKFNTNYGLFGGIMEDSSSVFGSTNCASRYLYINRNLYKQSKLMHRLLALYKFTGLLSFINSEAPWFFKSVNNLNAAYGAYVSDFSKEKTIEIGCSEEAVDMRLNTLFDLYTYACYDNVMCKEIIPENLRKFDMSIVVFNSPLRYYQTGIMATKASSNLSIPGVSDSTVVGKALNVINTGVNAFVNATPTYIKYKTLSGNGGNLSNAMSFQMFTFQNCEFDVSSFGSYYSNMSNEVAFNLGKNTIKIKFDRCYKHTMDEFNQFLLGHDKFYYNESVPETMPATSDEYKSLLPNALADKAQQYKRIKGINTGLRNTTYNSSAQQYKGLIDYAEYMIRDGVRNVATPEAFRYTNGNMYGDYGVTSEYFSKKMKWLKEGVISGNLYGTVNDPTSDYFKFKMKDLHGTENNGNIYNYDFGPGSDYFKSKLGHLHNSTSQAYKNFEYANAGNVPPTAPSNAITHTSDNIINKYNVYSSDNNGAPYQDISQRNYKINCTAEYETNIYNYAPGRNPNAWDYIRNTAQKVFGW